jgi:hypothetical protein
MTAAMEAMNRDVETTRTLHLSHRLKHQSPRNAVSTSSDVIPEFASQDDTCVTVLLIADEVSCFFQ